MFGGVEMASRSVSWRNRERWS